MSVKEKTSKPAEDLHKQVQQKASLRATTGAGALNPYIPYLIAASFVVMTALVTLLLTMVMENKAELDEVLADRQQFPEPILADARMAFGQGMDTGMESNTAEHPSALLSEENAIAPDAMPNTEMPAEQTASKMASKPASPPDTIDTVPTNSAERLAADVGNQTAMSPADTAIEAVSATVKRDVVAATTISQPAVVSLSADPRLVHNNFESGNRQLEKIVSSHEEQIHSFNKMLQLQTVNREEMQNTITHHMQLMESQIQAIEQILRPETPSAVVGYDRMIYRQRESFQRMMQRRNKMLQRALESRHRLREDYTLLLDLLEKGEEIAQLANQ